MTQTKTSLTKFGFAALAALIVSACGSSGSGSSSDNQPQQNNASNNTQPSQPTNNSQTNQTSNNQAQIRNGTGAAFVMPGQDDNVKQRTATLNGYNTTSINVDGTNITIGYPGIHANSWATIGDLKVCCGRYSDIRFGVSDSYDAGYMFYNGNPTQNMPTSGTATYSGEAIISAENVAALEDEDYHVGKSEFNVNFGDKTLNGALTIPNIQPVDINAKISGNSFTGTANSASLPSGQVEGKFYGNNAKEMAGLASDNKSWGATFGAAKQ
ncbi:MULTISPECIES: Slam-dependent surface lipoprotein [unclassified Pasteurella]|uniref:Slam-dependent surface lipoprotein n=1 Tax=unclassified Pasteurella TaxID=2621516 RepID=UPI00107381BA|nr:transferrin-binding protein-like solute binding protein [Pasteurella sp. 19428wF3_WM03]TFU52076.1 transferrin-binding protein 2 [Pasteurella sp. WM03]